MKPGKIRRFTRFQMVLHWGQATLYLALMATGGLLLFGRLLGAEVARGEVLSTIHRGLGIALILFLAQILLASLLTGNFVHFRRDIAEWLWFRPRDWLWLILVPIHAVWPRVKLPPAGRFNAGQKLHGAFVFLAVTVFIATGLHMIFVPGALAAWLLHAILFLAAACFLLIHLFLSLINPATRAALGGMFTGHVSRRYAESHHPLWTGRTEAVRHSPMISLKALLLTFLAVLLAAGGLVLAYGPQRFARQVARWAQRSAADALEPGELSAAHADIRRCTACHRWTGSPPSSACLSCHQDIEAGLAARQGYHGKLSGDCRTCHAEHAGRSGDIRHLDAAAFNHQQARFALQGKHQQLECAKCHATPAEGSAARRERYIGLEFATCSACHENPHGLARSRPDRAGGQRIDSEKGRWPAAALPATNSRLADCAGCHCEQGWRRPALMFDHARDSAFHLDGRHAGVGCPACHSPAVRSAARPAAHPGCPPTTRPDLRAIRPIPASATSPMAGQVSFALTRIGGGCADCHADPHRPTLGRDCERCHAETGWTGHYVRFNHDRDSTYVLRAAHAQAPCQRCHQPSQPGAVLAEARFAATPTSCASCHTDPHKGAQAKTCSPCHSERGWTGRELRFDHNHDSKFVLRDSHATLACVKCHVPPSPAGRLGEARFAALGSACVTCHKDPHGGQLSGDCSKCHTTRGWKGPDLLFDHNRDSSFKVDAIHSAVTCAACHTAAPDRRYRPVAKTCQGCHVRQADALAGKAPGATTGPADPHAGRVDCQKCHPTEMRAPAFDRHAQEEQPCRDCHGRRYSDLYYQWVRSLGDRQARAEALLAEAKRRQSPRAEQLAADIIRAKSVGMHNPQLAAKLWDDILQPEAASATATSRPGNRP